MSNLERLLNLKKLSKDAKRTEINEASGTFDELLAVIKKQATPTADELRELIVPLIPDPVPGDDGHSPTEEEINELLEPMVEALADRAIPTNERLVDLMRPLIDVIEPSTEVIFETLEDKKVQKMIKEMMPKNEPGPEGPPGPKGDKPDHKWDGTKLRFEKPDGEWGEEVDLRGPIGEGIKKLGGNVSGGKTKVQDDGTIITNSPAFINFGTGLNVTPNGSGVDVDAEDSAESTKTFSFSLEAPTDAESFSVGAINDEAVTVTEVRAYLIGTGSPTVTLQLQERGATTPNTAGTNILTSSLVADSDVQSTTDFANASIAAKAKLHLTTSAVGGTTQEQLIVEVDYTID